MLQQLTSISGAVLHTIFLDLQKAHGVMNWYRLLDILEVYGVGSRTQYDMALVEVMV